MPPCCGRGAVKPTGAFEVSRAFAFSICSSVIGKVEAEPPVVVSAETSR